MKLFQYFTLSILTHGLIWLGLYWTPRMQFRPPTRTIEVQILDNRSEGKSRQMVTDPELARLEDSLNKLEKKARFLSRETRRVAKEQVARRTGKTQNKVGSRSPAQSSSPQNAWDPPGLKSGGLESAKSDLKRLSRNTDSRNYEKQVRLSDSTISEFIPEVDEGSFTSLNTDQFLFYTFYSRINEQIRNRWVNNLRSFANRASPYSLNQLSRNRQQTQLEIILSPEGQHIKTILHQASESEGLDEAAALAFLEAQPFQNPPEEIVGDDGFIHLHYTFYVQWRPRAVAKSRP